ncbi:NAD(P)/FAD-dependent oxidoreductase [Cuniculiplasma sp. SKW4]|uniref:NAD(P)/FAD-dependent oxidoreductase n=1 Tax=Cuniculiplasma sp. SKW4 TaxID=3400171 RepID=UPI003FD1459F
MKEYDLIITGCGLSSLYAGMEALSKGMNVLMIEKSIDISYPPSGSMFISSQTYDKYFSKYEKFANGKFGVFTLKTESFEDDYLIEKGNEIVSMDREKLIRHMCADLASRGAEIRIKSSVGAVRDDNSGFVVKASVEGRDEEFRSRMIALGDGNINSEYVVHDKNCKVHGYSSSYSRSLSPRALDSRFSVEIQREGAYKVEAQKGNMKEILAIDASYEDPRGTVSHFNYSGYLHSCFPSTRKGMALLGNMMGTTRILGTPVRDVIELSIQSIRSLLDGKNDENENGLFESWKGKEESWDNEDLDPVDYIKEKLPVGL